MDCVMTATHVKPMMEGAPPGQPVQATLCGSDHTSTLTLTTDRLSPSVQSKARPPPLFDCKGETSLLTVAPASETALPTAEPF